VWVRQGSCLLAADFHGRKLLLPVAAAGLWRAEGAAQPWSDPRIPLRTPSMSRLSLGPRHLKPQGEWLLGNLGLLGEVTRGSSRASWTPMSHGNSTGGGGCECAFTCFLSVYSGLDRFCHLPCSSQGPKAQPCSSPPQAVLAEIEFSTGTQTQLCVRSCQKPGCLPAARPPPTSLDSGLLQSEKTPSSSNLASGVLLLPNKTAGAWPVLTDRCPCRSGHWTRKGGKKSLQAIRADGPALGRVAGMVAPESGRYWPSAHSSWGVCWLRKLGVEGTKSRESVRSSVEGGNTFCVFPS
jgi:hypothetical protein